MPSQQMTTGSTPMEGVERTNAVVMREQWQGMGASRRDPYAMKVDRGRNCYTCRGFRHMAQHCRNREQRGKVIEGRRLEHGERRERNYEQSDNLKGVGNLGSLD